LKYILKNALRVFGIKLAVSFITICMMIAFTWLLDLKFGFVIYSLLTGVMTFAWLFSDGKSVGKKLIAKEKSAYCGFLCATVAEIPSLVLLVLLLVMKNCFMQLNIAYWGYNAPFMGFFNYTGKLMLMTGINFMYVLPLVIVPLAYGIGYYFGYNRIESNLNLAEKLVYKENK